MLPSRRWLQVDKILLEVAGETLSQMAAAPRQQKQVRWLCGSKPAAQRSCRILGSAGTRIGRWQPTGTVLCGQPTLPGSHAHLPPRGCHCLVQAVQQAQPTEEEEDLQARLAAVKAG